METFGLQTQPDRDRALRSLSPVEPGQQTFLAASKDVQLGALRSLSKASEIDSFCKVVNQQKTWDQLPAKVQQSALKALVSQSTATNSAREKPSAPGGPISGRKQSIEAKGNTLASSVVRGSEDSIVPNSEDENSEVGSPKPKFDLSAYAFESA